MCTMLLEVLQCILCLLALQMEAASVRGPPTVQPRFSDSELNWSPVWYTLLDEVLWLCVVSGEDHRHWVTGVSFYEESAGAPFQV